MYEFDMLMKPLSRSFNSKQALAGFLAHPSFRSLPVLINSGNGISDTLIGFTAAGTAPGLFSQAKLTGFPLQLFSRIEKQSPNATTKVRKGMKYANIFGENDLNSTLRINNTIIITCS